MLMVGGVLTIEERRGLQAVAATAVSTVVGCATFFFSPCLFTRCSFRGSGGAILTGPFVLGALLWVTLIALIAIPRARRRIGRSGRYVLKYACKGAAVGAASNFGLFIVALMLLNGIFPGNNSSEGGIFILLGTSAGLCAGFAGGLTVGALEHRYRHEPDL